MGACSLAARVRRLLVLLVSAPCALLGCGGGGGGSAITLTPDTVDLTVDAGAIQRTAEVVEITFAPADCAVVEGSVIAAGKRRLLRFDTIVRNLGTFACVIGDPADPEPPIPADAFHFHDCHGHWHLEGFADYRLLHMDGTIAAVGHKQSFCIADSLAILNLPSNGFDCSFQGLSSGWADVYARGVPGQWIDVSGLPGGDYLVVVRINPEGILPEVHDVHPNTATVSFHLPAPSSAVAQLDDHADTPDRATEMPVPAAFQAGIQTDGDVDWFRLALHAGVTYSIRTELLTLVDSRLRVYDADGIVLLVENDDVSGSDLSSAVLYTPSSDEEVTVEVTGPGGAVGSYRLHVEEVP